MKNSIKILLASTALLALAAVSVNAAVVGPVTSGADPISPAQATVIAPVYAVVTPTSAVTGTIAVNTSGTIAILTNTTSNTWQRLFVSGTANFSPAN